MRFDVNGVLEGVSDSLVVREAVDLSGVRCRGEVPFDGPIQLTARAWIREGVVTLDCAYDYRIRTVCDRCLDPVEKEISQRSSHVVVRELSGPDSGEFVVAPDGIIELTELATNDIIPELPSQYLCREDCKGLCPVCGENRNEKACGCTAAGRVRPFEDLGRLLDQE